MKVTAAEWMPVGHKGRMPSLLLTTLRAMEVGQVVRIEHHENQCYNARGGCPVTNTISRLNQRGPGHYQSYHEKPHVAVVRRVS